MNMALQIALLALPLLGQTTTVSFSCRAETLSHLVVDLGKATGRNLGVTTECANDVLLVSAQGVSADRLLAEVAKVDAAQWVKDGQVLRLSSDSTARRAEARNETAYRAKLIKTEIQDEKALLQKGRGQAARSGDEGAGNLPGVSAADMKKVGAMLNGNAAEAAVLDLLACQDSEALVLPGDGRIVFSTSPNRLQTPMATGGSSPIDDYVAKRNEVAKILHEARAGDSGANRPGTMPTVDPINGYSKADLSVKAGGSPGDLDAQLALYTSTGGVAVRTKWFSIFAEPQAKNRPSNGTKIEISEPAKAFRRLYIAQGAGTSALVGVPAPIAPYLTDPEHNDPLALSTSDELMALAKSLKQPLVAVIPDSAFNDAMPDGAPTTLEEFSRSLEIGGSMIMANSGDWVEIKPACPDSERQYRCDRTALGRLLRASVKEGIPTLDEFADFTAAADFANNPVVQAYLFAAVPGYGHGGLGTELNWSLYRIYAELTASQRASLIGGAKLPMASLTANQWDYFSDLAYGALQRLTYGAAPAPLSSEFPSARRLASDPPSTVRLGGLPHALGYEKEPTELLPDGPQDDGYVELKVIEEPFVSPSGPATEPLTLPRVVGIAKLAVRMADPDQGGEGGDATYRTTQFKLGTRRLLALTVHAAPWAFVTGRLYDFHLDRESPNVTMDDLPAGWKAEMNRRVASYRQDRAAGRAAPPP